MYSMVYSFISLKVQSKKENIFIFLIYYRVTRECISYQIVMFLKSDIFVHGTRSKLICFKKYLCIPFITH